MGSAIVYGKQEATMIELAIAILWLAIGVIVLAGVVYLFLLAVKQFVEIPAHVEKAIWLVVLILILIAGLSLLAGGGGHLTFPRIR